LHLLWRVDPQQAADISTYQLIGMDGRIALQGQAAGSAGRVLLDVRGLSPGLYTVILQHGLQRVSSQKVVIGR